MVVQNVAVEYLLATLIHDEDPVDPTRITVLTPYRAQRRLIARTIENSNYNLLGVVTKSVASFQVSTSLSVAFVQGCESDVVVVSVGTSNLDSMYLSDQLVNVMLTRQKLELFIVTNTEVCRCVGLTGGLVGYWRPEEGDRALPRHSHEVSEDRQLCRPGHRRSGTCCEGDHEQKPSEHQLRPSRALGRSHRGHGRCAHLCTSFSENRNKVMYLLDHISFVPPNTNGPQGIVGRPFPAHCGGKDCWMIAVTTPWLNTVVPFTTHPESEARRFGQVRKMPQTRTRPIAPSGSSSKMAYFTAWTGADVSGS